MIKELEDRFDEIDSKLTRIENLAVDKKVLEVMFNDTWVELRQLRTAIKNLEK